MSLKKYGQKNLSDSDSSAARSTREEFFIVLFKIFTFQG